MQNIDYDLRSVQEVRDLARLGQIATEKIANYTEDQIDRIIQNMVRVAEENAVSLAQMIIVAREKDSMIPIACIRSGIVAPVIAGNTPGSTLGITIESTKNSSAIRSPMRTESSTAATSP